MTGKNHLTASSKCGAMDSSNNRLGRVFKRVVKLVQAFFADQSGIFEF